MVVVQPERLDAACDAWHIRAVNHLLAAGMVLRYRSQWGNSFYLGWKGRKGVLRVSDHPGLSGREHGIHARLTLHDGNAPKSDDVLVDRCAVALGHYLMKTVADDTIEFSSGQED